VSAARSIGERAAVRVAVVAAIVALSAAFSASSASYIGRSSSRDVVGGAAEAREVVVTVDILEGKKVGK
jgi:hypothetical protein